MGSEAYRLLEIMSVPVASAYMSPVILPLSFLNIYGPLKITCNDLYGSG